MTTHDKLLLLPAFIHVGLIFVLIFMTGMGRVAAARRGEVRLADVALDASKWSDRLRKRANNYQNQFELPVLYYALIAFLLATHMSDAVQVILAWLFVLCRLVHSYIHVGKNVMVDRFYAFLASVLTLLAMWVWFALRLLLS
jgi:hypothetical protein